MTSSPPFDAFRNIGSFLLAERLDLAPGLARGRLSLCAGLALPCETSRSSSSSGNTFQLRVLIRSPRVLIRNSQRLPLFQECPGQLCCRHQRQRNQMHDARCPTPRYQRVLTSELALRSHPTSSITPIPRRNISVRVLRGLDTVVNPPNPPSPKSLAPLRPGSAPCLLPSHASAHPSASRAAAPRRIRVSVPVQLLSPIVHVVILVPLLPEPIPDELAEV